MKKVFYGGLLLLSQFLFGQAPTWSVNSSGFEYSMQVTCKLNKSCADLANSNNKIGAFVGNQCRGVVNSNIIAGSNHLALLVIYSNNISGEKVSFKIYDQTGNTIFNVLDTVVFSSGAQIGSTNSPKLMTDNYAPTNITISNQVIMESTTLGTTVATLGAVDDNAVNTFTFTLPVGVLDNGNFTISGSNLVLNTTLDYELDQSDSIEIKVTDAFGCSFTKRFKIYYNDQNDPPTEVNLAQQAVHDLDPVGTFIGIFSTIDQDPLETFTYTFVTGLGDTNNTVFDIRNDSIFSNQVIVYDSTPVLYIRVRSTDAGGLFVEDTFEIHVIDSNDPTDIWIDTLTIKENNPLDFFIGKIHTADLDPGDTFTYQLVAGAGSSDNSQFFISGDSLFIRSTTMFDVKSEYFFRIETSDKLGHTYQESFKLKIVDDPSVSLSLPSANYISPNDDGKNDFWTIVNVEVFADFSLQIFDSYGFVVYQVDSNYNNEWDGKLNGKALPTGNYYYIFKNENISYKGNITLAN